MIKLSYTVGFNSCLLIGPIVITWNSPEKKSATLVLDSIQHQSPAHFFQLDVCGIVDASVRGSCLRRCRVTVHSSAEQWSRLVLVAVNVVLHQYSGEVEFHNNKQQAQIFLCKFHVGCQEAWPISF